ncbi:MAG: hypothetical protein QG635_2256 [Bacteroidota bacterium]|nr:hypothetical protein [Bacteroidota bacterium]
MKKILLIAFAVAISILIAGCSESTSPAKDPEVKIAGELATQFVNIIQSVKTNDRLQANEVDSIKIVRIRILMSGIKLFLDNEDTSAGKVMKTGPFIYDINIAGKLEQYATAFVPPGIYEKIKIEFHRFSANETNQYANDPIFMDFATADRFSIIIEGITYKNNDPSIFIYKSQSTANLLLKFDPALNLISNSNTTISINADPNFFLKKWSSILDPSDPKNAVDIENSLINSIKANKK